MPGAHAKLSASGSTRWMNCPGSVDLESGFPESTSAFAEEGTLAHSVCELKAAKYFLSGIGPRKYAARMNGFKADPAWADEMEGFTDDYLDYLKALALGMGAAPYVAVEKRLDLSAWIPDGFGTADCVMVSGEALHVVDFKYGKGVPVSPDHNTQLMIYALGAVSAYGMVYSISHITLHIVQPRIGNTASWMCTLEDLLRFGETVKARAEIALSGNGETVPGDHCRFCKARAVCRARADKNLELAGFTKSLPPMITNEEVGRYLGAAKDIAKWASDLEAYALSECLAGREVGGWKAVSGRSNRKITDEAGLAKALTDAGFAEAVIYKPRALESVTALEKLVGKKEFALLSEAFITKPEGKPTLVPASDKRPPVTNVVTAEKVFEKEN